MLQLALWPILALIMGIAFLIGAGIVTTIVWCTANLIRDMLFGDDGEIWCPVLKRQFHVHGTPRGSMIGIPFSGLKRCERWGEGHIECKKACLVQLRRGAVAA
jgi:hypothetical protein